MNSLEIKTLNSVLVVDSRLIANELDIQHSNLFATIKKYEQELLMFNQLLFQTDTVTNSTGAVNQVKYVYLTEDQATFLMTLSRNTEQVVRCKLALVKKFSEAKTQLAKPMSPAEMFLYSAQKMVELEQKQAQLEAEQFRLSQVVTLEAQRTDSIEALVHQHDHELDRVFNSSGHYYTIMGYCSLKNRPIAVSEASKLGKKASRICRQAGITVVKVADPRFGRVGSYPEHILDTIIS